ncbi:MAG: alpha/beta fold hydrolase [Paracoccaceae bacterium]
MSQPEPIMPPHAPDLHHRVGGLSCIERPGHGAAVLFLHGIGSNAQSFLPVFAHLPSDLRLIAWNAPGYLDSDPLADDWPVAADYARAALRLLDGLGARRVHVVGHSLGTLVAAALAEAAPRRLLSLTLAAAAQGYGVAPGGDLPAGVAARLEDLDRQGPRAFARARAARLVHAPEANPDVVAQVETEMARVHPRGYGQAVQMLASGDLAGTVARLTMRPSFIIGEGDVVTPRDQTDAAAGAWTRATGESPPVEVIAGAGHAVPLQAPGAFAEALLKLVPALHGGASTPEEGEADGR